MNFDKITILDETDESIIEPINIDIACYALSSDAENVKQVMTEYAVMKEDRLQQTGFTRKAVAAKASTKHDDMRTFSMPAISKRTDFPNHITHRDITTKPEN